MASVARSVRTVRQTLKYLAAGWWITIASVDCSGWSCISPESSTPIRDAEEAVEVGRGLARDDDPLGKSAPQGDGTLSSLLNH
jgi:hypothetical protein